MNPQGELPRSRGPYSKSDAVRAKILEAAWGVFARDGYRAGVLREIANVAGMSEAGVLYHFPTKQALMLAVLDRRDEWQRNRSAILSDDPRLVLMETARIAGSNADEPGTVALYAVLSAEATSPAHPAHDYFKDRYSTVREVLSGAFATLAERGHLTTGRSPESLAIELIALMDGLQIQWLLDRRLNMAAAVEEFLLRHVKHSALEA